MPLALVPPRPGPGLLVVSRFLRATRRALRRLCCGCWRRHDGVFWEKDDCGWRLRCHRCWLEIEVPDEMRLS